MGMKLLVKTTTKIEQCFIKVTLS